MRILDFEDCKVMDHNDILVLGEDGNCRNNDECNGTPRTDFASEPGGHAMECFGHCNNLSKDGDDDDDSIEQDNDDSDKGKCNCISPADSASSQGGNILPLSDDNDCGHGSNGFTDSWGDAADSLGSWQASQRSLSRQGSDAPLDFGSLDFGSLAPRRAGQRGDPAGWTRPRTESSGSLSSRARSSHRRLLDSLGSLHSSVHSSMRRSAITLASVDDLADELLDLGAATRGKDWLRSFRDLDPRFQILEFFNDLSLGGVELFESNGCFARSPLLMPKILRGFIKSGIFSVWRPTSKDAIRRMMKGEGTGKGLDIKGKSAKRGVYSGFVPFLQIHDNDHKKKVGTMRKDKRVRVFYPNESSRDTAVAVLTTLGQSMMERAATAAQQVKNERERRRKMIRLAALGPSFRTQRRQEFFMANIDGALTESMRCLMQDPTLYKIDKYAKTAGVYGLDIPERLFWEGYIVPHDIQREKQYETGRPSMPEFQQMNLETLRKGSDMSDKDTGPRPVLWHGGCGRLGGEAPEYCNPMCPIDLLMAYEENGKVTPVVSDFDCFLLGTRGVKYREPLGAEELSKLSWCVDEIEGVLETPAEGSSWTARWLDVKKRQIDSVAHEEMPLFGYADPRSYSIMKGAVHKVESNGAVRHGPECFNYCFPQELDDQYLIISDTFEGIPWRYTNAEGLIDILCQRIDAGFTFPLHPKWVLCDSGWKRVYDKLMGSQKPNVQDSIAVWYPGRIRERIDEISAKFPQGFVDTSKPSDQSSGVRADLAELELRRYKLRVISREKLRGSLCKTCAVGEFMKILEEVRDGSFDRASIQ